MRFLDMAEKFVKELRKAESEFFEECFAMILFLEKNGYDLDTIRDMLIVKIDNAIDEYEKLPG